MKNNSQIDPNNWEDTPQLGAEATYEDIIERLNLLTNHMNYIIKSHFGIM